MGVLLGIGVVGAVLRHRASPVPDLGAFDGERAYRDIAAQVALGPRTVGSQAHAKVIEYITAELEQSKWEVTVQQAEAMGHPVQNILARRGKAPPVLLLGAHYDSRLLADRDSDPLKRTQGVPAANDGASGVAVLLELARTLPQGTVPLQLAFFDAEDNGEIAGWDWLLGSRAYVSTMIERPQAMILVDMIGNSDLTLPLEQNSDPALARSIWATAKRLGYGNIFLEQAGLRILDDHVPFIEADIPAVDIIDINYAYWHTSQDTLDKVSAASLQAVGETLLTWVEQYQP